MNDRQRLEAIVSVVCRYLPPNGISINEAMSEIIGLVDPLPQPTAQPLTPEWIWMWLMDWCKRNGSSPANYDSLFKMVADARAIEAAHGITKGNT